VACSRRHGWNFKYSTPSWTQGLTMYSDMNVIELWWVQADAFLNSCLMHVMDPYMHISKQHCYPTRHIRIVDIWIMFFQTNFKGGIRVVFRVIYVRLCTILCHIHDRHRWNPKPWLLGI
jgi:hypothetical protein